MGNKSKKDELPQHDIRPEVSQFIRNEMHVTNKDIRESLSSDVKEFKNQIKSQNWKIFFLLISIFGVGNVVAVYKVYSLVQTKVEAKIEEEFGTEKIQVIIGEKAKEYTEKKAQNYIAEKVDRSIKPFSDEVRTEFAELQQETSKASSKFNSYLEDTKIKFNKEYLILANQVDILTKRNKFTSLGDQAINGNGKAFDELIGKAKQHELETIATAEIGRVKTHYLFATSLNENDHISLTSPDGAIKKDNDIPPAMLLDVLRGKLVNSKKDMETRFKDRALAARFLGEIHEKEAAQALLDSACNDENLEVRKIAIQSFSAITGYIVADVLECKYVTKWWNEHKSEVEKSLK